MNEDQTLVTREESRDSVASIRPTRSRWRSCCFEIDPGFCRFAVCVAVSIMLLISCIMELWYDGSCDQKSFYGPIISLIIGIWTPTPKNTSKK